MSTRSLNVALIGYGYAGASFHAPLLVASEATRLAAIVTSNAERAKAAHPDARIVAEIEDVLADATIDAVVVATPNDTHEALAWRALEAGKHVVIDKPIALSEASARRLFSSAAAHGRVLAPFHNRRWDGDFLALRGLLAAGALGRVVAFESRFDRFRPQVRERWREDESRGGGLLFDLGPHLVDQAIALFGAPRDVMATVRTRRDGARADDDVNLQLGYADKDISLRATMLSALDAPRFILHGTRGSYSKSGLDTQEEHLKSGAHPTPAGWDDNAPGTLCVLGESALVTTSWPTPPGNWLAFYRSFASSVCDGAPFPISPDEALLGMRILELARLSSRDGVRFPVGVHGAGSGAAM